MWGLAWEGVHRGPELLLNISEVNAGMVVRCQVMVSAAGGGCHPLQSMTCQKPDRRLRSQGGAKEWQII